MNMNEVPKDILDDLLTVSKWLKEEYGLEADFINADVEGANDAVMFYLPLLCDCSRCRETARISAEIDQSWAALRQPQGGIAPGYSFNGPTGEDSQAPVSALPVPPEVHYPWWAKLVGLFGAGLVGTTLILQTVNLLFHLIK